MPTLALIIWSNAIIDTIDQIDCAVLNRNQTASLKAETMASLTPRINFAPALALIHWPSLTAMEGQTNTNKRCGRTEVATSGLHANTLRI